jgi:cytidine deaminase
LEIDWDTLLEEAWSAREGAYVPYSHFPVGAALLGISGRVWRGTNLENASYPLTICAERVAAFKARSEGETKFLALAVVAESEPVATPCGACRQVLVELTPGIPVLLANRHQRLLTSVTELLPMAFTKESLPEKDDSR